MNNEPNNKNNVNTTNTTNTNNVSTTSAPNINPAINNIKEAQNINTSAFAEKEGPRIDTQNTQTTNFNAAAFNTVNQKKHVDDKKIENKPTRSKAGLIIFLLLLVIFVVFLPDVNKILEKLKNGNNNENITEGELRCSLNKSTDNFDITYEQNIPFKDSKLLSLNYIITTKGDVSKDKNDLEDLDNTCNKLSELASSVDGMEVSCEFAGDKMIETHTIDYDIVDSEKLKSAYTENGGTAPGYDKDEDIDSIQKKLQAIGYTCKKIK